MACTSSVAYISSFRTLPLCLAGTSLTCALQLGSKASAAIKPMQGLETFQQPASLSGAQDGKKYVQAVHLEQNGRGQGQISTSEHNMVLARRAYVGSLQDAADDMDDGMACHEVA